MARGTSVPITPDVLAWAIQESGHQPAHVAVEVDVDPATMAAWLKGRGNPNLTQFHALARFLKRPEALFFLPRRPQSGPVEVQFRAPPGAEPREPTPEERLHVREAARLQRGLAWISEQLGDEPPSLERLSADQNAEEAAQAVRERFRVSVAEQLEWRDAYEAQRRWRAALEREGIAVLFLPMGKDAARGFSLWDPRAPLVAVNTHWNAQARAFTMFHECAHLLTRTSSLCAHAPPRAWKGGDRVERWCEQFAAAFLAPWGEIERLLSDRSGWNRGDRIRTLDPARYVANKLHVSLRAAVLRLVDRGAADWPLYQAIPPVVDTKRKGGPTTGGRRRPQIRVDEYGVRATRAFLEGVRREAITRDDALRYLDVADTEVEELEALTAAG